MDVRKIIITEFRNTLQRRGQQVSQRLLEIAEYPFNLQLVQSAVDNDIRLRTRRVPIGPERRMMKARLEQGHEEQLRRLSRKYALKLIEASRKGYEITESRALIEQLALKVEAGRWCDVYPCERQQIRG